MQVNGASRSKWLTYAMWICISLWLAVQIAVVLTVQDIPQQGDALRYQQLAEECLANGSWYPMRMHIETGYPNEVHPLYICYPGLVNMLEFYLKVFGTIKVAFWINILWNLVILGSIWQICTKLINKTGAKIAIILFCLYPLQALIVAETLSEIPCMALIYLSLVFASKRKYGWIVASAVLMILSQYVRTVALLFVIPLLIYMIIKNYGWRLISTYIATAIVMCVAIFSFNKSISGYGFLSSTTLGMNMLIGAYEDSMGNYIITPLLSEKVGPDLVGKNVFEIDSVMREHSYKWIEENPDRWISLAKSKIDYELWPERNINLGRLRNNPLFESENKILKPVRIFWVWFPVIYQYGIYVLALIGIFIRRKCLLGIDGLILLPFLGSLALAVLTVGHPRYNMPFMPVLIYFAVWSIIINYKKITNK